MRGFRPTSFMVLFSLLWTMPTFAQKDLSIANNAALRYWSAFSVLQDSALTDQQAKELNATVDGTASYDDAKYKELLEKNRLALEIMVRGASLPSCDWGLDYRAEDVPVEYARKALVLGRLNVLYAFHLFITGDKDGAVQALAAGIKFSHDAGNGGSLFATLVAKTLLESHFRAIENAIRLEQLSSPQKARLQQAVAQLGEGLDWNTAAKLDLEGLRGSFATDAASSAALNRIISSYVVALNDPSKLPALNDAIRSAPKELASVIPNATRVLEQKRELSNRLLQTRSLLK